VKRLRHWAWSRPAGAALILSAALLLPALQAGPVRAASASPSASGAPALLAQTPWVEKSGLFRLRLQLPAGLSPSDHLEVQASTRLTNRTDFDGAVNGVAEGFVWYSSGPLSLAALPADPAGGVDVDIPVNQAPPAGSTVSTFSATVGSGVYPLVVGVYNRNGLAVGQHLPGLCGRAAVCHQPAASVGGRDPPLPHRAHRHPVRAGR